MDKLKELGNSYFYPLVIIFAILIGWMFYTIYTNWNDGATNRTVSNQTNQANQAVQQAVNAQNAAVNADVQRQTEDAIREKVINPKLNTVRRQSQNSKRDLDAAKHAYENAKNNPSNLDTPDVDNCRKLNELFPNVNFTDCQ